MLSGKKIYEFTMIQKCFFISVLRSLLHLRGTINGVLVSSGVRKKNGDIHPEMGPAIVENVKTTYTFCCSGTHTNEDLVVANENCPRGTILG